MHVLANQHYLGEKESPAHWSGPAQRYQEGLTKLNVALAVKIGLAPAPYREIMNTLHSEVLQLRRMVSEGVIRAMVRDEFWKQYAEIPHTMEAALKIVKKLEEELGDRRIRLLMNEATAPQEERPEVKAA